jgi:Cellulose biosynthesis protein BcsS
MSLASGSARWGAYGRYRYDGALLTDHGYVPATFDGEDAFLAALAGYQFRTGRLITKLFAGIEAEDQHIVPHDPNNPVQRQRAGFEIATGDLARHLATVLPVSRRVLWHRLP